MIATILVPIDGSPHSKKALELACDLASKYEAKLHLLHIVQAVTGEYTMALGSAAITMETTLADLQKAGQQVINAALEIAEDRNCETVKTKIEIGNPAQKILDYSNRNGIDMIVMGSRGLSDLAGFFLGSISHRVSHLAECSCVTVR